MKKLKLSVWLGMLPEIEFLLKCELDFNVKLFLTNNYEILHALEFDFIEKQNDYLKEHGFKVDDDVFTIPEKIEIDGLEQTNPAAIKFQEFKDGLLNEEHTLNVWEFTFTSFAGLKTSKTFINLYQLFREYKQVELKK